MTALHDHRLEPTVDVAALHTAYRMLAGVDRELTELEEWARRQGLLAALSPYAARQCCPGSLDEWEAARVKTGGPPWETQVAWARRTGRVVTARRRADDPTNEE